MKKRRTLRQAWVLAVLPMALAASAAEVSYDFTVCSTSRRLPVEAQADAVAFGAENWGVVSSSNNPFWERAVTHCAGYLRVMGGKVVGKGVCKWTEQGGDSAVGEWEYPAQGEPVWTWLAGTGKLRGIKGSGSFKELFNVPGADPAVGQGCRRDWGSYTLP